MSARLMIACAVAVRLLLTQAGEDREEEKAERCRRGAAFPAVGRTDESLGSLLRIFQEASRLAKGCHPLNKPRAFAFSPPP
jgi:hypothetical protein